MTPLVLDAEDFQTLSALLDQGLELQSDQRAAWLDGLTGVGDALRQTLRELLARDELIDRDGLLFTLPRLPAEGDSPSNPDAAPNAGEPIGAYRLIRLLGRGGMGSVWLAERSDGVIRRQVALKLAHRTTRGDGAAGRLERERDILAGLTHPNIARLYDAGVSRVGQPFIAMEFIDGVPLPAYCDTHGLSIPDRLRLFDQVLTAVRHAHSKLVIHRDLKPSNILVTTENHISLLDFGIAKLLVAGEARDSELTEHVGRALTPSYASPEQIAGLPLGTATDIYSLGVILYELLTGKLPYRLKRDSRGALEQAILDAVPPRLSQMAGDEHAARCGTTPAGLVNALRGDLDAIADKALRKTPAERYADVREFADDLKRHLAHQPVRAREGARIYVMRRFMRRHWRPLAAAATVFILLLAGIGAVGRQARIARIEADKALAVKNFLLDIFRQNSVNNPDGDQARHTTAEQLLDISGRKIHSALRDQPEVRAEMLATLGDLYDQLELFDKSGALARERLADLQRRGVPASAVLAEAKVAVGRSLVMQGRYAEGSVELNDALHVMDLIGDASSATRAQALLELGSAGYHSKIDDRETLRLLQQSAALYDRCCAASPERLGVIQMLGRQAESMQKLAEAEQYYRQFLALATSPPFASIAAVQAAQAYDDMGSMLLHKNRFPEAEQNLRQALQIYDRTEGATGINPTFAKAYLGQALIAMNRAVEGEALLGDALRNIETTLGVDDAPRTAIIRVYVATAQLARGELAAADRLLARNAATFHADPAGGIDACPQQCILSLSRSAMLQMFQGQYDAARKSLARANELSRAIHIEGGRAYGRNRSIGATLEALQGDTEGASAELHRITESWPATAQELPEPYVLASLELIEITLQRRDSRAALVQANDLLGRILALPQHEYLADWEARAQRLVGVAQTRSGQAAAAEPHLRRAVELRRITDVADSPWLAEARISLAEALLVAGKVAEARRLLDAAAAAQSKQHRLGDQYRLPLRSARANLARASRTLRSSTPIPAPTPVSSQTPVCSRARLL